MRKLAETSAVSLWVESLQAYTYFFIFVQEVQGKETVCVRLYTY